MNPNDCEPTLFNPNDLLTHYDESKVHDASRAWAPVLNPTYPIKFSSANWTWDQVTISPRLWGYISWSAPLEPQSESEGLNEDPIDISEFLE